MKTLYLPCCFLLLALTACTASVGRQAVPAEERSTQFVQGLDEMTGSGRSETLGRLAEDPNAGPWRERARSLLEWKERAGNLSRENENLRQQLRQARATEEQMARDNASLKKDLEQLKRILVEMESRPK